MGTTILKEMQKSLPKDAEITEVKFEGPEIVLYTKNPDFFRSHERVIREMVSNLKKRIEIRPDQSITLEPEKAKKLIDTLKIAGSLALYNR